MSALRELVDYNAWATRRVIAACEGLAPEQLDRPHTGVPGTIRETLTHLVGVEDAYLRLMTGADLNRPERSTDLDTLRSRAEELAGGYRGLLAGADETLLAHTFTIPWFSRDLTIEQGLVQVTTHSVQHRTDVTGALSRMGIATPPLDYVFWALDLEPPA